MALTLTLSLLLGLGFLSLWSKLIMTNTANAADLPPEVIAKVTQDRVARESVTKQNPQFFAAISNAMFFRDPIGINCKTNTDEYDAGAGTVIPRLEKCTSSDEVVTVLHEEFTKWFGADTTGDPSRYAKLAKDIWILWQQKSLTHHASGTR